MAFDNQTLLTFYLALTIPLVAMVYSVRSNATPFFRRNFVLVYLLWCAIQFFFASNHWYSNNLKTLPPVIFTLGIMPVALGFGWVFLSKVGSRIVFQFSPGKLILVHLARIPVELCLLWLAEDGKIPHLMSYAGWNFDIIMGLSAPVIFLLYHPRKYWSRLLFTIWNLLGIALVSFVVILGVLSAPFPLQCLAFDQPNLAILHAPMSLLPTAIVPAVLFAHIIGLRNVSKLKHRG